MIHIILVIRMQPHEIGNCREDARQSKKIPNNFEETRWSSEKTLKPNHVEP